MSEHEDRTWLLYSIKSRTTKAQLLELIQKMPVKYRKNGTPGDYSLPKNKPELVKFIEERRQLYWQDAQRTAPPALQSSSRRGAGRGKVVADLCEITASECNEFLRTLPPVPPFGFEDV